ncbi:reverse transcriptase domain, reverse transcriptase zinc-binding domain protein [Tanacetum coccineum]
MEDSEWHEVKRRKNRSVFDRLGSPLNRNYKPIEFGKEIVSVYVSNFPSHLTVRELTNICGKMGKIANVYVSKRKNKLGQMFAFCRYNKIDNKEALIDSLNMIWIGKLRLHANIARFDRKEGVKHVHADVKRQVLYDYKPIEHSDVNSKSYANRVKSQHTEDRKVNEGEPVIESPSIMLSQEANSGLSLALIGCYKDFRAIGNSRITCRNEGFVGVETKYLGGLWVLFEFYYRDTRDSFLKHEGVLSWFSLLKPWHDDFVVKDRLIWLELEGVPLLAWNNDTFKKIGSRWGEVLFIDDNDNTNRFSIRLCIKSSHAALIFASFMVTVKGVSYAIRVRELCSWTPSFSISDEENEEEQSVGRPSNNVDEFVKEGDDVSVAESVGDIPVKEPMAEQHSKQHVLKDADDNGINTINTDPFELADLIARKCQQEEVIKESVLRDSVSTKNEAPQKCVGISMLEQLEDTIKVGVALGFNMDGCEATLEKIIAEMGDETKLVRVELWTLRQVWGNIQFDFASTSARGRSGCWIQNGAKIMFIAVYAPQTLAGKIELWSSLSRLISN